MWPEVPTKVGKAAQNREKEEWKNGKPKLNNAWQLSGIYFIDPDDQDYKETLKHAKKQIERDKQKYMNCPCIKRGILRLWVNCWLKFMIYRTKLNSCQVQENFPILNQGAGDSGLRHDTRNIVGTSGIVFVRPSAPEGRTSTLLNNPKNLASSFLKLGPDTEGNAKRPENEMRREPKNSSTFLPRSQRGTGVYDHTGGTYSHNGMIHYPTFPISELHLGKFPDSMELRSWKVKFKTEVSSKTAYPHITMHWITEVEMEKSIDEHFTSRSTVERNGVTDMDMLDAMIATALKRLHYKHMHFRKKSKCRTAACSKIRPILTRKTNCLHDLRAFPCNGNFWSGTSILRLIQKIFSRMTTSKISTFDGIMLYYRQAMCLQMWSWEECAVKITGLCSASDCVGFVWPRNCPI